MKYLGLHKLLWFLLCCIGTICVIFFAFILLLISLIYESFIFLIYTIWNLKIPHNNFWYKLIKRENGWEKQLLVNLKYFPTYCKEEFVHHFNKLTKE